MVKDLRLFFNGIRTSWKGMRLTLTHLRKSGRRKKSQDIQAEGYFNDRQGQATVTYPYEEVPVPDHGRYQLYNEIEDCIVCDKCAKICPVDCIDIEPIKSAEEFGKTSDGTPKRIYAAKFDIDMAKCCFCGLCTTVCPTECLTMTPEYDFSVFELGKLNFGFGDMTEEEAETKRKEWEIAQQKKQEAKAAAEAAAAVPTETPAKPAGFQPRMRPAMAPKAEPKAEEKPEPTPPQVEVPPTEPPESESQPASQPTPAFRPRMRPVIKPESPPKTESPENE
jgi:formate hydrogenlyase subunit 6/NADH:ubiquinone oxidoreductase subunit I